jgi:hypothetical protein
MGDGLVEFPHLKIIEGGLMGKRKYKSGDLILLDKIRKNEKMFFIAGRKKQISQADELQRYRMISGENGQINVVDLRIILEKRE